MLQEYQYKSNYYTRLGCSYKQFHVAPPDEWYSI